MLGGLFSNISVGKRLNLGFATVLLLLLLVAGLAATQIQAMGERVRQVVEVNNEKSALANRLLDGINAMGIQARSLVLLTDAAEIGAELKQLDQARELYARDEAALATLMADGEAAE